MNIKKIISIFQSFYINVSVEKIALTLPISFEKRYQYAKMKFHKESFLLIKEKRRGSLNSFVTQARTMGRKASMDVILVFSKLSDNEKKQLLQARVPFVDFKGNLFFPPLGLALNANDDVEVFKELTPSEQLTWIAFLLTKGQKVVDVDLLSQITGLPNSTIYRCLRTFKTLNWLNKPNKLYAYTASKKELFLKSESFLFNPIKKRLLLSDFDLNKIQSDSRLLYGGTYALSYLTFLAESDENSSYVISQRQFNKLSLPLSQHILEGKILEIWRYSPFVSEFWNDFKETQDRQFVDPISLYLTLKDDDDPRVEEEIEALKNNILQYLGEDNAS
ncbi:hypothetical protein KLI59_004865 [Streptococcus parasanguinis]|jgi:hypothetical protein|uniref:hypothetical protein n=1 Tax=Streptococcus parasanguinis TaxID=1318 RepID=UPI001897D8EC|nr:hypothetical protein [Streptococcus parasanguinis]MBT3138987.1 hypothetical protein [Streptococcus parasanguinis]MCY7049590.1 hypothetical protein [Streptococcus parasanguinis]